MFMLCVGLGWDTANFPKPEPYIAATLTIKEMNLERNMKWVTPKEIHEYVLRFAVSLPVPLPEALVRSPLPLPGEIVRYRWCILGDNEGALVSCGGGWWEVKNVRCRKHGVLVAERSSGVVYV